MICTRSNAPSDVQDILVDKGLSRRRGPALYIPCSTNRSRTPCRISQVTTVTVSPTDLERRSSDNQRRSAGLQGVATHRLEVCGVAYFVVKVASRHLDFVLLTLIDRDSSYPYSRPYCSVLEETS